MNKIEEKKQIVLNLSFPLSSAIDTPRSTWCGASTKSASDKDAQSGVHRRTRKRLFIN